MVCPYIYILTYDQAFRLFFFTVFCGSTKVTKGRESSDGRLTEAKNCSVSRKKTCLLSVAFAFLNAIFLFLTFLFVCLYFRIWLSVCNTTFITAFICLRTYFHWHFEVVVLTWILVSVIPHHTTFAFYGDGEPTQTKLERLSRLT